MRYLVQLRDSRLWNIGKNIGKIISKNLMSVSSQCGKYNTS